MVLAIAASEGGELLIVPLLMYLIAMIYLIRLLLWNSFGKEVYQISKNKIYHYNDYGFFKENITFREFKKLRLGVFDKKVGKVYFSLDKINERNDAFLLFIRLDEFEIQSVLAVDVEELKTVVLEANSAMQRFQ